MPSPSYPKNERSRLEQLYALDILDTPEDELSNAIVMAAASVANTPMAAISLVDEHRQWFKGAIGLDVRETGRAVSFCAHAILTPGSPLIVPDARLDARFADNALVFSDPGIRFYAGFPLRVGGHAIGALCVIDDMPRALSVAQVAELRSLAEGAAAWLETHGRGAR